MPLDTLVSRGIWFFIALFLFVEAGRKEDGI